MLTPCSGSLSCRPIPARREGRVKLSGPDRYVLTITPTSFAVECAQGTPRFSGIATSRKPKLYIVSVDNSPTYVGITKQPLRNRLRFGWSAEFCDLSIANRQRSLAGHQTGRLAHSPSDDGQLPKLATQSPCVVERDADNQ